MAPTRRTLAFALLTLLTTSACALPAGAPSDESATATPRASAAWARGDGPRATVVGSGPVIGAQPVAEERPFVNPGAVVVEPDGTFTAFVTGFGAEQGTEYPTLATSSDGARWSVAPEPIFEDGLGLQIDAGPVPTAAVHEPDGTWTLYGWAVPAGNHSTFFTWRATAPSAAGPWIADPEPVLERSTTGVWDDGGVGIGAVQRTDDGYVAFYQATSFVQRNTSAIGIARSADGRSWRRELAPVLRPGLCGGWDERGVVGPSLLTADGGYVMAYGGFGQAWDSPMRIGLAGSTDGVRWSCLTPDPILEPGDVAGAGALHAFKAFVAPDGPRLLVEALRADEQGSEIWTVAVPACLLTSSCAAAPPPA